MSSRQLRTKLTYDDYVLFPDDGKRHEIVDGDHFVTPSPATYHQKISGRLHVQLFQQIEETGRGEVYHAPTDLQFSDFDVVVPDLIVVLDAHRRIIGPAKIEGVPDLAVEILSPSTTSRDRGLKLRLYERFGVPEYWIVDPDEHVIEQYVLEDARYRLTGRYAELIDFTQLADVTVDLRRVW